MYHDKFFRVRADVNLSAVRSNIDKLKEQLSPRTKVCAVVKANAYGHGAVKIADSVYDQVDYYAVATMDEALELRSANIDKPILILGYVHPSMNEDAIYHDIRFTVYDEETAKQISAAASELGKVARIHLKIDTGMGRVGFPPDAQSVETIRKIREYPRIEVEGIFTHFANADEENQDRVLAQLNTWQRFLRDLNYAGIQIPLKHCSNSAAATNLRDADMDMVRLGISIYGLYPSEYVHQIELTPALSLKSHVVLIKTVPEGTSVSYGSTWTAQRESRIATVPVGYADGYMRSLSNKGYVLIGGKKYPVVGRVCMDQIMVDVTDGPDIQKGDEAVLIGTDGDETITMEEISELAGSFNYEFACDLSRRVPRRYFLNGKYAGTYDQFEMEKR